MADKQYRKLPANQQTTAVKNFFESTVEQLFSKANIEQVSGFVGRKEFVKTGFNVPLGYS